MAIVTPLGKRLMENVADQSFAVAAVRVVAGEAQPQRRTGETLVTLLQTRGLVAGKAEGIGFLGEQLLVVGLVRTVTGYALSFGIWGVRILGLPGQVFVTGETALSQFLLQ